MTPVARHSVSRGLAAFLCGGSAFRSHFGSTCSGTFAQAKPSRPLKTNKAHTTAILRDAIFHSSSLNRGLHYRILLPADYEASAQRYPTLFLLHGLGGDDQNCFGS